MPCGLRNELILSDVPRYPSRLFDKSTSVAVCRIAIDRVHMHGQIAAGLLWRELDEHLWSLNFEVSGAVSLRFVGCRTAPGEKGIVQSGLDFHQTRRGIFIVDDAGPFGNQVQQ